MPVPLTEIMTEARNKQDDMKPLTWNDLNIWEREILRLITTKRFHEAHLVAIARLAEINNRSRLHNFLQEWHRQNPEVVGWLELFGNPLVKEILKDTGSFTVTQVLSDSATIEQ